MRILPTAVLAPHMPFVFDDGGRAASGRRGKAGDCVCRAISICIGLPYTEVYGALAAGNNSERGSRTGRTARGGIHTKRQWFKAYMQSLGFSWTPCMSIGSGCQVHLVADELPSSGRIIAVVSGHYVAIIDGVIHDTHDSQRRTYHYNQDGNVERISERCVYGYWSLSGAAR